MESPPPLSPVIQDRLHSLATGSPRMPRPSSPISFKDFTCLSPSGSPGVSPNSSFESLGSFGSPSTSPVGSPPSVSEMSPSSSPAASPMTARYSKVSSQVRSSGTGQEGKSKLNHLLKNLLESSFLDSESLIEEAEEKLLAASGIPYEQKYIAAGLHTINTIIAGEGKPLVLLHGFGSGVGLWTLNLKEFANHHKVYAIDLPGFGRSSRVPFSGTSYQDAENYFVDTIEQWRKSIGLEESFALLGHSFGGCIATSYSLKYPSLVASLILADPWGISHVPERGALSDLSMTKRIARRIMISVNPLKILRKSGGMGPSLVAKFRKDLVAKFEHFVEAYIVAEYLFHINSLQPAGETAFSFMHKSVRWSQQPLVDRLENLSPSIQFTILYGSDTWITVEDETLLKNRLQRHHINCRIVPNAGHHIYADNVDFFHEQVLSASKVVELSSFDNSNMDVEFF